MTIVFDLDDTLYREADFVRSAFRHISELYHCPGIKSLPDETSTFSEAFDKAARRLSLPSASKLIDIYRNHHPDISLSRATENLLRRLSSQGATLALVTDGRSVTQRHKINALHLERYISPDMIFISEETGVDKTSAEAFLQVERISDNPPYCYIGDNPAKDFHHPRLLGWHTVMLANQGQNIHPQNLNELPEEYHPQLIAESIEELSQMADNF